MKISTLEYNLERARAFVAALTSRANEGERDFFLSYTFTGGECVAFYFVLFDRWGEILFSKRGSTYNSEWHIIRQGKKRDAVLLQSLVCNYLSRAGFPLVENAPFVDVPECDSVLRLNIDWERRAYLLAHPRPADCSSARRVPSSVARRVFRY